LIEEDRAGDFRRVTLAHENLIVSVLPELGGKITMLRRDGSDRNAFLAPSRPYRRPHYSAAFEDYDTSGFDECFPTVSACESPDEAGKTLPDHGDLWSAEWTCEAEGENGLLMEARGVSYPYVFRRRITIKGDTLRLDYELESEKAMRALWSAHPLLAVSQGSQIILPAETDSLFVNWSANERLGNFGDFKPWPETIDGTRLDILGAREERTADKLFAFRLREGFCAYYDRASDESILFRFDLARTPYIGLWICQGGWPISEARDGRGHYTIALEPCSGLPDSLAEAAKQSECLSLEAGGVERWWLEITLQPGMPVISA
jgi:galactose mutarotase-like enzyme